MKPASHHLDWIRRRSCVICGSNVTVQAAHVRFADARAAKPITGMGIKPRGPDGEEFWVLPLCLECHHSQHSEGERGWWQQRHVDPVFICMALARVSGDDEAGDMIIESARK